MFLAYKLGKGYLLRDSIYELKNEKDITEDLTEKEEDKCQKVVSTQLLKNILEFNSKFLFLVSVSFKRK